MPSARIHGLNLHRWLLEAGSASVVLRKPSGGNAETLTGEEVEEVLAGCRKFEVGTLILQKVNGEQAARLAVAARGQGIHTVFLVCDSVDNRMAETCDVTIAVSGRLKRFFHRQVRGKIHVLDDPLEIPPALRNRPIQVPEAGRLRGVYLGSAYPDPDTLGMLSWCAEIVDVTIVSGPRRVMKPQRDGGGGVSRVGEPSESWWRRVRRHGLDVLPRLGWKVCYAYRTWAARREFKGGGPVEMAFIPWDREAVYETLCQFDVGLIPILLNSNYKTAKSANRVGTLMGLGLPVVTSPLPAYREHAREGEHVLYASSRGDWLAQLSRLDRDRGFAAELAARGRDLAWARFGPDATLSHLQQLLRTRP